MIPTLCKIAGGFFMIGAIGWAALAIFAGMQDPTTITVAAFMAAVIGLPVFALGTVVWCVGSIAESAARRARSTPPPIHPPIDK
ncbi:MAG: hypothetical protein ACREIA_12515 [Opitutaceae bacterium]